MFKDSRGLLLVDQRTGPGDKVFRVGLVLTEHRNVQALGDACNGAARELSGFRQVADQVVFHRRMNGVRVLLGRALCDFEGGATIHFIEAGIFQLGATLDDVLHRLDPQIRI